VVSANGQYCCGAAGETDFVLLDEPTSGLDPGLEKKMMYDLNRLADEGRTVVLVTHATANIEQCDHVAFLSWVAFHIMDLRMRPSAFSECEIFSDIYLKLSGRRSCHPSAAACEH